ncbi:MAG: CAP domain-containing protein [Candidatus Uhrbacteria bacterium]|nr:CAP domain-containing protein [Candidatus Uhrbacteria bacterium]
MQHKTKSNFLFIRDMFLGAVIVALLIPLANGVIEIVNPQASEPAISGNQLLPFEESQWILGIKNEVNNVREEQGLNLFVSETKLDASAKAKAQTLEERHEFSHTLSDGTPFYEFIENEEYYRSNYGENLAVAFPDPLTVVEMWMLSPGHRAILLDPKFNAMGVGVVIYTEEWHEDAVLVVLHVAGGYTSIDSPPLGYSELIEPDPITCTGDKESGYDCDFPEDLSEFEPLEAPILDKKEPVIIPKEQNNCSCNTIN